MKFESKLQETRWNIAHEKEIWKLWQEKKIYKFNQNAEKINTKSPKARDRIINKIVSYYAIVHRS